MDTEIGGSLDLGWDRCRTWDGVGRDFGLGMCRFEKSWDEVGRDFGLGMCRFERSWDEVGRGSGLVLGLDFGQGQGQVRSLVGWGGRTLVGQVAELKR